MKHTHASIYDLLHLYTFVETIIQENIEGDIVECGCWRGGSSAIMLKRARELNSNCHIYIYDSFEGLPPAREVEIDGQKAQKAREKELAWLKADHQDVVQIMKKLNIYDDRVHIVKGWFNETTPHSPVSKVALLHSDGDLYESTKTVLENFYHKVDQGGFVVNNDYGEVWIGAKKAMDEFVDRHCHGTPIQVIRGGGAYLRKP
jgi:O-methyltransferase